jgi:hypothetical protein
MRQSSAGIELVRKINLDKELLLAMRLGAGDECPGAQGDGLAAKREFVGSPAMRAAESGAFGVYRPGR